MPGMQATALGCRIRHGQQPEAGQRVTFLLEFDSNKLRRQRCKKISPFGKVSVGADTGHHEYPSIGRTAGALNSCLGDDAGGDDRGRETANSSPEAFSFGEPSPALKIFWEAVDRIGGQCE
jgi:hypothetical protein